MVAKKQIIILNGGGHKGIVKVSGVTGKTDIAKVSCSLDFRPNNAKLYLIGENVAQMALNDTNCEYEVAFSAQSEIGCVLRSSSITMFGGNGSKSDMLKKIENANEKEKRAQSEIKQNRTSEVNDDYQADRQNAKSNSEVKAASIETTVEREDGSNDSSTYVGAAAGTSVLGEWTKYDGNNFYYAVKPQIDEMFVCYPEERILVDTVPNSKWVRVEADDGYYVVGLLYDEDEPSFICYGVPQLKTDGQVKAPAELENMCVWLPISVSDSISGYWIIYQSAKTGEIIK